jgi:DNA-binding PadR family transcriptional regulator
MSDSYKVPFYILGFLIRLGPLHGYQLKAHIEREARDFAKIKLPNLYYHLGAMKERLWIESTIEKDEGRPEREVFSVTEEGRRRFGELFERCLGECPEWDFPIDGALFFSKGMKAKEIARNLTAALARANAALALLASHRGEVLAEVPPAFRETASLILAHHERHYAAERDWLVEALRIFSPAKGAKGAI